MGSMFVLPPPPRYPNGNYYTGVPGTGLLETNNILERPSGPEYQLVVGEGTYILKDDLHLATPPPHPSDVPQPNNNPLATFIGPPTAGTKLSIAVLAPRRPTSHLFRTHSARTAIPPSIQEETQSHKSDTASITNGFGSTSYYDHVPAFGDNNPALQAMPVKNKKELKPKPKNNIIKSNSSYVSRVIPHEAMPKRLAEHAPDGIYAFANVNRAFMWLDLSSELKTENMTKILFTKAHALCHDINPISVSSSHLDLILGFNTSDIIWYEPMSQKYARLNKNGQINPSPVLSICWIPNKENLFLAAHMDGTLVAYDKEKEDAVFAPEETQPMENGHTEKAPPRQHGFQILKSVLSKEQRTNPVAVWKLSNMKINSMAFSPDGQLLAVACEDGTLRIIDHINERVRDVYRSFYGAMMCVTWSPDGRYVLTGGEDDLVSIWSLADQALVARCIGHHSWVTDVKFDPWRCDERNYRFGSVGEDCRLLLWDFSVGMLGRSKALSVRNRNSVSSHMNANRKESYSTVNRIRSNSSKASQSDVTAGAEEEDGEETEVVHPVDSKAGTAVLPPVMSKKIDEHPLAWLGFEEHCILTSSKEGHVREWSRPTDETTAGNGRLAPAPASAAPAS